MTVAVLALCGMWMPARARRLLSSTSIDLEGLYNDYQSTIDQFFDKRFQRPVPLMTGGELSAQVALVLEQPTDGDLEWLISAFAHQQRRWFLAGPLKLTSTLDNGLFVPLLEAVLDGPAAWAEAHVAAAVRAFGYDRVCEYLNDANASADAARKRNADTALYFAYGEQMLLKSLAPLDAGRLPPYGRFQTLNLMQSKPQQSW